jgi:hypothetical protein
MKKETEARNDLKKEAEHRTAPASRTPTAEEWEAWFRKTVDEWNRKLTGEPPTTVSEVHPIGVARSYNEEPMLTCPVCGFEYVHPVGLVCKGAGSANTELRLDSHGVHQNPQSEPWGRGVRITMEFLCEGGHRFDYSFTFHKGWTFLTREVSADELHPDDEWPEVIWRN